MLKMVDVVTWPYSRLRADGRTDGVEPGQVFDSIEISLKFMLFNMLKHLVLALKSDFQGRAESPNAEL